MHRALIVLLSPASQSNSKFRLSVAINLLNLCTPTRQWRSPATTGCAIWALWELGGWVPFISPSLNSFLRLTFFVERVWLSRDQPISNHGPRWRWLGEIDICQLVCCGLGTLALVLNPRSALHSKCIRVIENIFELSELGRKFYEWKTWS